MKDWLEKWAHLPNGLLTGLFTMDDSKKTKAQLIEELNKLRARDDGRNSSELRRSLDLVDHSNDAIYVIDAATGRFLDVTERAVSDLGYTRDELLNMGVADIQSVFPDERAWQAQIGRLKGIGATIQEGTHNRKDGTTFPVEVSIRYLGTEDGNYVVAVARDITERKKAEEELRRSEKEFQDLFGSMREGFALCEIICDHDGKPIDYRFLKANSAFGEQSNMKVAETVGRTIKEIYPDIEQQWIERYGRVAITQEPISFQDYNHNTDKYYDVVAFSPSKGRVAMLFRDVTQAKKAEHDLIESEAKYRTLFERESDAIFIYDPATTRIVDANEATSTMYGYDRDELIGMSCVKLSAQVEDSAKALERVRENGEVSVQDRLHRRKDGTVFPVDIIGYEISLRGKPVMFAISRDITERKAAERREKDLQEKLTRAERMESLGVLAGGVAHDLNNILGPMVLLPDIIAEDLADSDEQNSADIAESLSVIKASANRAATIVKDLVALGRRGNYSLAPLNINEHHCIASDCTDVESIKTANPDVSIVRKLAKESLIISADDSHLSRAISNLLQNAAESIEKKGKVTIKTARKSVGEPLSGYEIVPKGDYAVIEISDTGAGIDEKMLVRMFEPFVTRKKNTDRSGSGLGLSVVHGIVKDHNGFIDVESEVGKGSVFTLYLPLIEQQKEEGVVPDVASVVGGTERVLIVDDEPGQRYIAHRSLKRLGYEVAEVEDGHQALEHFEKAKKEGEESPYDLVVLDMVMEDGFDGLKTYQAIQELFPKQKVIICSGYAEDSRAKAAEDLGADWLAKPYEIEDLATAVRERLDRD